MKSKSPPQYPVVSIDWIRRAMRRALLVGFVCGAGLVAVACGITYLILERTR